MWLKRGRKENTNVQAVVREELRWEEREKRQDGSDKVSVNNVNNAAWKWKVGGEILNDVGFTSLET